jgi:uncharacterized protein (TIGR00645 family)
MINRALANILLGSRWLLAAFYLALVVGLVELLVKTGQRVYELCLRFFNLSESGMILGALSLTASLVLIVIFSGYANFVSPIDPSEHADWPRWMTNIDFGELKLKLMASIVAITAVKLLEAYMNVDQTSDRDLWWLAGLHVTFVVSALLMALTDRIGQRRDNRAS